MIADIFGWDVDAEDIAGLSLLVALLATVLNPLVAWFVATRGHRHERELAHDQRLYDRRAEAYVDLLANAERYLAWIGRTEPIIGPVPDPPPMLDDEQFFALNGRVAAYGSAAVLEAERDVSDKARAFSGHVFIVRQMRGRPQADPREPNVLMELHEARGRVQEAVERLRDLVRQELTTAPR